MIASRGCSNYCFAVHVVLSFINLCFCSRRSREKAPKITLLVHVFCGDCPLSFSSVGSLVEDSNCRPVAKFYFRPSCLQILACTSAFTFRDCLAIYQSASAGLRVQPLDPHATPACHCASQHTATAYHATLPLRNTSRWSCSSLLTATARK